jgi:hypothetical protein
MRIGLFPKCILHDVSRLTGLHIHLLLIQFFCCKANYNTQEQQIICHSIYIHCTYKYFDLKLQISIRSIFLSYMLHVLRLVVL